jgi:hypothetical protein
MDEVRLKGGKYSLTKIEDDKEIYLQSGYCIAVLLDEDKDVESFNLVKVDRPVMVGSLTSRDFWRTSLIQEILEYDEEKDSVLFATLNSVYRITGL